MIDYSIWAFGILKSDFLSLPGGTTVLFRKTKLLHHSSIGITFWIMSVEHALSYQVAESYAGKNLHELVKRIKALDLSDHSKMNIYCFRTLMKSSQYGSKLRKNVLHLFGE